MITLFIHGAGGETRWNFNGSRVNSVFFFSLLRAALNLRQRRVVVRAALEVTDRRSSWRGKKNRCGLATGSAESERGEVGDLGFNNGWMKKKETKKKKRRLTGKEMDADRWRTTWEFFSYRRRRKRQKSSSLESRRCWKKKKLGEIFEKKKNSNWRCDETTNERRTQRGRGARWCSSCVG